MKKEIWKDIKGYEGLYQVSNFGNVWSFKSNMKLKISLFQSGYCRVSLYKNNKAKTFRVHRLVAFNFIENTYNKQQINHIDGCKSNNNVSNLEWCTSSENQKHAFKTGLQKSGGEHHKSRATNQEIAKIILLLKKGYLCKDIAKELDVNLNSVYYIAKKNCFKIKTKLNEKQVKEIRNLLKNTNMLQKDIGKMFGVDTRTISSIKTGVTWKRGF